MRLDYCYQLLIIIFRYSAINGGSFQDDWASWREHFGGRASGQGNKSNKQSHRWTNDRPSNLQIEAIFWQMRLLFTGERRSLRQQAVLASLDCVQFRPGQRKKMEKLMAKREKKKTKNKEKQQELSDISIVS